MRIGVDWRGLERSKQPESSVTTPTFLFHPLKNANMMLLDRLDQNVA